MSLVSWTRSRPILSWGLLAFLLSSVAGDEVPKASPSPQKASPPSRQASPSPKKVSPPPQKASPPPQKEAPPPHKVLQARLRANCAARSELKGCRVTACLVTEQEVTLRGLVERSLQVDLLQNEALQALKSLPALKAQAALPVKVDQVRVFPLESQWLPKLQHALATRLAGDLRTQQLMRRCRLDAAGYFLDGGIVFELVSLDSSAAGEVQQETRPADSVENRLIIELEDILESLVSPEEFEKLHLFNNKVKVLYLEPPAAALQAQLREDSELDGVLLEDAVYDGDGHLRFVGLLENPKQREPLAAFLSKHLATGAWRSAQEAPDAVADLREFPLSAYVAQLQEQLPLSDSAALHESLVSRAFFAAPGAVELRLLTFHPALKAAKSPDRDVLLKELQTLHEKVVAGEKSFSVLRDLRAATVTFVSSPLRSLAALVEADPQLDGIRLDAVTIDSRGRLALRGVRGSPVVSARLEETLERGLVNGKHALSGAKFDLTALREVPTRDMLQDLQRFVASNLAETRLDRLYFNRDGKLRLSGQACRGVNLAPLRQQFQAAVLKHVIRKHWAHEFNTDELLLNVKSDHPSLLSHIRELVAQQPALDGVSIVRGYFDVQGTYVIQGVQDRDGQSQQVVKLVTETARGSNWRDLVKSGVRVEDFPSSSLSSMVSFLQKAMPAYKEFDGIALTSVFHDGQNQLSLRGRVVGQVDTKRVAEKLKTILDRHAAWKSRVAAGINVTTLTATPRNPRAGQDSLVAALDFIRNNKTADAVPRLDDAVLHDPDNSTVWFIRGMSTLQTKPTEARRDLFRAAVLEQKKPDIKFARLRQLEFISGQLRQAAEQEMKPLLTRIASGDNLEEEMGAAAFLKPAPSSRP